MEIRSSFIRLNQPKDTQRYNGISLKAYLFNSGNCRNFINFETKFNVFLLFRNIIHREIAILHQTSNFERVLLIAGLI